MSDCDHRFRLKNRQHTAWERDDGLPKQITVKGKCKKCGKRSEIDYNLAFVDGEKA